MLISVVIPVYNTSSYLARCIDSIFEQDLKDVELIFIDDHSTDNSFEVLNQCLKGRVSENLTIVKNPKNLGSGETRNKGISLAKGDYVIFVDSDDYVTSDYFLVLKNAIESRPDIVVFDMTEIWSNKMVLKHVDLPDSPLESVEHLLLNKMHNSLCNKMFKRSMFLKHDIRITKGLSMFEDKSICFKLFYYAKSQLYIDKSLYFYDRSRENSLTKVFKESNIQASVIVAKVIDDFFKDKEVSGLGTGQLPDKEGQMYHCEVDDFYLIPTAEVPVTNIYRDVILPGDSLPKKNCAYSACFRREAGSYGKDVRGLNRLHQFDKVEIVRIEKPENSYAALEEMKDHVQGLLDKLGLPWHILRLCGGDMSFTSAITFDFEVWSGAQERWLEVSSVSNFETYQANRLKCRYRGDDKKTHLCHTLNGSALALPRIMAALLENNQTPEGIKVPEVLQKYTGFDIID